MANDEKPSGSAQMNDNHSSFLKHPLRSLSRTTFLHRRSSRSSEQSRESGDGGATADHVRQHQGLLARMKRWGSRRQEGISEAPKSGHVAPATRNHGGGSGWAQMLVRPLKQVRDSYVDCMIGVAENPHFGGGSGYGDYYPEVGNSEAFRRAYSARRSQDDTDELIKAAALPRSQSASAASTATRKLGVGAGATPAGAAPTLRRHSKTHSTVDTIPE